MGDSYVRLKRKGSLPALPMALLLRLLIRLPQPTTRPSFCATVVHSAELQKLALPIRMKRDGEVKCLRVRSGGYTKPNILVPVWHRPDIFTRRSKLHRIQYSPSASLPVKKSDVSSWVPSVSRSHNGAAAEYRSRRASSFCILGPPPNPYPHHLSL